MKALLLITAVIEAATGVSLVVVPSTFAQVLLGAPLEAPAAVTVAGVAGAALLALAIACWLAASDARSGSAQGMVSAMLIYNLGAAVILGLAGIRGPPPGIALWPAVILHVAMTVWCVTSLLGQPNAAKSAR
jgi:quinol-cytochrome oxidoreductase complex cytochrome b subunit